MEQCDGFQCDILSYTPKPPAISKMCGYGAQWLLHEIESRNLERCRHTYVLEQLSGASDVTTLQFDQTAGEWPKVGFQVRKGINLITSECIDDKSNKKQHQVGAWPAHCRRGHIESLGQHTVNMADSPLHVGGYALLY